MAVADEEKEDGRTAEARTAAYGTKTAAGNSRVFNCKLCNRAFTREEHLTRHTLLTHNRLKPFNCGICGRPFSRRDLLLRHAKNLHEGSELAVSRIRKVLKRNKELSTSKHDEIKSVEEEKAFSEDDHRDDDHEALDDELNLPTVEKNKDENDEKDYQKRENNKLKMSVSTLVS